ncbi:hypothetical protein [Bartonella taylorii]|uniref:hypothetical protein n=1 Tax=Bartonella taylorii TaxID=33046 RepID=UPI001FEE653C|nr:hypothetical protein [Bartonella taylorii]
MQTLSLACDGQQSSSLPSLGMAGLFPQLHYLTPEEEKHLQAGSDGNRRMFYNGILTHQMKQPVMRSS